MPLDAAAWPFPVVEFTRAGRLLRCNPAARQIIGDMLSADHYALERLGLTKNDLRDARGRASLGRPALLRRRTPGGFALCITVIANDSGNLTLLLSDDTARVMAEAETARQQALLGALADIGDANAAFVTDPNGCIIRWSRSAERLEGLTATEATGMTLTQLLGISGIDVDAADLLANAERHGTDRHEGLRVSPTRGLRWIVVTVTAAYDDAGSAVGYAVRIDEPAQDDAHAAALRRLAETDALTGALNHRAFDAAATAACTMARARGEAFAVIALDIDAFKAVNDCHGHAMGNEALRAVVNAAQGGTRRGDLIGRLGGDEFAIALPCTGADLAGRIAERLLRAIRGIAIGGGKGPCVTVSIGVAAAATPSESFAQTLARADHALYRAKAEGRDRIAKA